jgi:hypothetical protein
VNLINTNEHVTESLLDHVLKHLSVLWDLYFVIILMLAEDARVVLLLERIQSGFKARHSTEVSAHLFKTSLK